MISVICNLVLDKSMGMDTSQDIDNLKMDIIQIEDNIIDFLRNHYSQLQKLSVPA